MTCKDIFNGSTGNRATVLILEAGEPKTGVAYNAAGLVIAYRIDTGSQVAITLTSGNWFEIGGGKYLVDVPDSIYLAANLGKLIQFYGTLTDCAVYGEQHRVVANDPSASIAEAVAQYDQRDEDSTPGTIGWSFKKLRQANQAVEFVVTNDITPTTTTFSIDLTAYDTSAFAHSVLLMLTGSAAEDNGVILSYTNNVTYATILLEKPMANAPSVGDEGLIRADSHVHAIADIAGGVWNALVASYQAVGSFGRIVGSWFVGDWSITRTFQVSGGDKVAGIRMSLVGLDGKSVYSGTDGVASIKAVNGTYTLRVVVPAGYEDVADTTVAVNGADSTATVTLVPVGYTPANPPASTVTIPVRSQFTDALEGVEVRIKFIGWESGATKPATILSPPPVVLTDANGLATVTLYRLARYQATYTVTGDTVKVVPFTVPNAGTHTVIEP